MSFLDSTCFDILDVFKITRKASSGYCIPDRRFWSSLAFRISGQSVFLTENKELHANDKSILFIPSYTAFTRKSTDEEMIVIHLEYCKDEEKSLEVLYQPNFSHILSQFYSLLDVWEKKEIGYKHRACAMLHNLLAELKKSNENDIVCTSYKQLLIKPGSDIIDNCFDDPTISIPVIAKKCNMSGEYFRKLYKEIYGISPYNAIMENRIKKACHLLQSGYFSISEVSEKAGFQNCKYFSTLFRKTMKMSPRDYKKLYSS